MVENRAGGPEGAGESSGAEGTQAADGPAGTSGATGAGKRGSRRSAAGSAGGGAGEAAGSTGTARGRRGAATKAGGGQEAGATGSTRAKRGKAAGGEAGGGGAEGGATGTRKRGARATGGASTGGSGAGRGSGRGRSAATKEGPDLRQDLRDFATAHEQGWNHQDWLNLVNALHQRGHDVGDRDRLGRDLERERLSMRLEQVQGIGERHVQALVDHFGTLWSLRQASIDEIAQVPNVNRELAEKIREQVR